MKFVLQRLIWLTGSLGICVFLSINAQAQTTNGNRPFKNRAVYEILEFFRAQRIPIAYSNKLVPDTLRIQSEPINKQALAVIREILEPHGLALKEVDGIYLVIREARGPPSESPASLLVIIRNQQLKLSNLPVAISSSPGLPAVDDLGSGLWQFREVAAGTYHLEISAEGFTTVERTVVLSAGEAASIYLKLDPALLELQAVNVSASRYLLFSNSQFFVDQRAIESLPGNADDPIRAMQRLPGAAAGGWSAQSHFRGGENNESAIFLNGLQLLDPFHARDFHNTFSSIDARTISGVEAYTGGFPASYGDRMSGILILQSSEPEKPRHYELGVSVFNTSLLASGFNSTGSVDWLVSARRSNLGLILVPKENGEPDYNDLFASLGVKLSADTRLTFNFLRARDQLLIVSEPLPEEREQSTSDTRNQQIWMQLEKSWSNGLDMSAVLSASSLNNERSALVNDDPQLTGYVLDDRDVKIQAFRLDFQHYFGNKHLLSWGVKASKEKARYRYQSQAEYGGIYLAYPGVPDYIDHNIMVDPSGGRYAVYISDRWRLTDQTTIDAGLRWDKQTYIGPADDDQLSPRISLLYSVNPQLDLRLTLGRYHQSQGIQHLQVEDGVDHFFPAQQADHFIAGIGLQLNDQWSLRAEAFVKRYSDLRPRYENLLDSIPLIPELEPDRVRIAPSSAHGQGVEITLQYNRDENLNWWATYTLSRITDRIDGRNELRNWDQKHAFQAGLVWQKGQWDLGLSANIHSGWPTTLATLEEDDEGNFVLVYGPRNAVRLNTFASFGFRASRYWPLPRGRLSAFFEVSNLFNRNNQCCVDYDVEDPDQEPPVLERSINNWLGILPAVGMLWEF